MPSSSFPAPFCPPLHLDDGALVAYAGDTLGWDRQTPADILRMGLAAMTGNIPVLQDCLAKAPRLLHIACGHPAMGQWLGDPGSFRTFSKTYTPFAITLLAVEPEATLWLMDQPGFRMITEQRPDPDFSGNKAPLSLLMVGVENEPGKGSRILPLFQRLCEAGLSPLQEDESPLCPLAHLLWATRSSPALLPCAIDCLKSLDLSATPPLKGLVNQQEWRQTFRELGKGNAKSRAAMFGALLSTGWTEPVLGEAVDLFCPKARVRFEASRLKKALPAAPSPKKSSPARL